MGETNDYPVSSERRASQKANLAIIPLETFRHGIRRQSIDDFLRGWSQEESHNSLALAQNGPVRTAPVRQIIAPAPSQPVAAP
jgi:hypothetical protein